MRLSFSLPVIWLTLLLAVPAWAALPGLTSEPGAADSTEETLPDSMSEPLPANEPDPDRSAAATLPSPLQQFTFWVAQQQRSLHRALSGSMEDLDREQSLQHVWALVILSFLYGVFHAAGPGHGKAVISTYMLTQPTHLRQGVLLSVAAALMQGVTAIVLVLSIVFGLGMLAREAVSSVQIIERVSFTLIAILGLVLIWRASAPLRRNRKAAHHSAHSASALTAPTDLTFQFSGIKSDGRSVIAHPHQHAAGEACSVCGKQHHVSPEQLAGNSALQNIGLVLSIGARPCTGAVLVLVVANLLGLWWAGVLGVLAMSLGTALTVSVLAILAVTARSAANRFLGFSDRLLSVFGLSLAAFGGAVLLLLGSSLLLASLTTQQPFGIL